MQNFLLLILTYFVRMEKHQAAFWLLESVWFSLLASTPVSTMSTIRPTWYPPLAPGSLVATHNPVGLASTSSPWPLPGWAATAGVAWDYKRPDGSIGSITFV